MRDYRDYLDDDKAFRCKIKKDPNDLRIRDIVKTIDNETNPEIGILGIPFDEAVTKGGGREGAGGGPEQIRGQIERWGATFDIDYGVDFSDLQIVDFGDLKVAYGDTRETHLRASVVAEQLLKKGLTLIVLGGGHDLSYGTIKALSDVYKKIGGVNIDAHLDVRELKSGDIITSGTPFRRLLEERILRVCGFYEVGARGVCNSQEHFRYLKDICVEIMTLSQFRKNIQANMKSVMKKISSGSDAVFASLDIDAMAQCYAPGSSAPSPEGFNPWEIKQIAFEAGKNPKLKLFEIMEYNPLYDRDYQTARLIVDILASFFCGYRTRINTQIGANGKADKRG